MSKPPTTSPSNERAVPAKVVAPPEPRWVVLVMLFVLMGALAVPMLWRSPHFSQPTKVVLSIVAFIQTAVVLVVLALVLAWFIGQISATLGGR